MNEKILSMLGIDTNAINDAKEKIGEFMQLQNDIKDSLYRIETNQQYIIKNVLNQKIGELENDDTH